MTTLQADEIGPLVEGAVGLRRTAGAVQPIRLPVDDLELQHQSLRRAFTAESASGVRLRFRTTSRFVALEVTHDVPEEIPSPSEVPEAFRSVGAPVYDLVLPDGGVRRQRAEDKRGVVFDDLPAGEKIVEIWFPPSLGVLLHGMSVERGASVDRSPHTGSRWATYGSSITHGAAMAATETWPAVAARTLGWNLTCLGFNGDCHLDPFVARAMAALPVDRFTLKLGINVHASQTLRERTFAPLVHGFLATLRDAHPTTPITVISPILCPEREDSPISMPVPPFQPEPLVGDMSLRAMRAILQEVVEVRRRRGDDAIDYLDGLELLGHDDAHHLPDGIHPSAAGCALIAGRFAAHFGAQ